MPPNKYNAQSGNVFIVILIGVVLFGALMYMFSRSAQQGTGNISKQSAKLVASEILSYARLVESAVDRVRRNGCSESEISFANDIVAGYEHAPVVRDECRIFDEKGGKLSWIEPPSPFNETNGLYWSGHYSFISGIQWNGTGCNGSHECSELTLLAHDLNLEVCENINKALGIEGPVPIEPSFGGVQYVGTLSSNHIIADETTSLAVEGESSACFIRTLDNTFGYIHVLLAR